MKKVLALSLVLLLLFDSFAVVLGEATEIDEGEQHTTNQTTGEHLLSGDYVSREVVSGDRESEITSLIFSGGDIAPLVSVEGTGEVPPPFVARAQLVISEVFFDGSDERFELSNIGSGDFVGSLVVRGVKSTDLHLSTVTISPNTTYVWGDTMAGVRDRSVIRGSSLGLSISDSSALFVSLLSGSELLDTFSVDSSTVSSLPNNYGFEKAWLYNALTLVSSSTGRVTNISGTWIANPGSIMSISEPPLIDTSTGEIATGSVPPDPYSGATLTGINTTGIVYDAVVIQEVHPGQDILPEYIELLFRTRFVGNLIIGGAGVGAATKTIAIDAYTGQYLVVTDSVTGFVEIGNVKSVDSLSLTDGGEMLTLADSEGNEYDRFLYTGSSSASRYKTTTGLVYSQLVTPGFSEKVLGYFSLTPPPIPLSKTTAQETYYQSLYKKWKDRYYDLKSQIAVFGVGVNTAGRAYKKEGSSEIELVDNIEEFAGENLSSLSTQLHIVGLLPDAEGKDDGNEYITIQLLSGENVNLDAFVIHANSKKTALGGMLDYPGKTITIKGTFGLANKPSCVTLESNKIVYDTFCYGQPKGGVRAGITGNIVTDPVMSGVVNFDRMKKLELQSLTGEVCAFFGEISFDCLTIKPVINEKKMASVQKKLDKKTQQYTTLQERYKKTKETLEAKRRKYYLQLKELRAINKEKLATAKLETKVRKNYGKILQNQLKKNRPVVRQSHEMKQLQDLYETNIDAIGHTGHTITLQGNTFALGDFTRQYAFVSDTAVATDYLIVKGLSVVSPEASATWSKWLNMWYKKDE